MNTSPAKTLYLVFGFLFVAIGAVGVVLPLLPTTPFLILAAFCFSRGSEKWHRWLLSNPTFGPSIRDWESHGIIRLPAKRLATLLIAVSFTSLWFAIGAPVWAKLCMVSVGALVLVFIWTRPSVPRVVRDAPKKDAMSTKEY